MSYDFRYEVADGVATITLDRPELLNALTFEVYAQLRDLMEQLRSEETVRALVITGAGRGFCSGGDVHQIIGAMLERGVKEHLEFTRMTGALVANMRLLDKPIIAALNGTTAGAGAVIALAADLRLIAEGATISFLFSKVGLTGADMGAAYLLPRLIGQARAMELLMFGDPLDAASAERYGLVNRVLPAGELLPTAQSWARRLADGPSLALRMTKRMVNNEWNMDLLSAIEAEAQAQAILMMAEDHRSFYEAFKQKQAPVFKGR